MAEKIFEQGLFTRWRPVPEEIDDQQRLEQQLNQITDAMEFGPVPGAYFPISAAMSNLTFASFPTDFPASVFCLPDGLPGQTSSGVKDNRTWSLELIYIGVWVDKGEIFWALENNPLNTVNINSGRADQGTVLHTTDVSINIAGPFPQDDQRACRQLVVDDPLRGTCQKLQEPQDFPTSRPVFAEDYVRFVVYDIGGIDYEDGNGPVDPELVNFHAIFRRLEKVPQARE